MLTKYTIRIVKIGVAGFFILMFYVKIIIFMHVVLWKISIGLSRQMDFRYHPLTSGSDGLMRYARLGRVIGSRCASLVFGISV